MLTASRFLVPTLRLLCGVWLCRPQSPHGIPLSSQKHGNRRHVYAKLPLGGKEYANKCEYGVLHWTATYSRPFTGIVLVCSLINSHNVCFHPQVIVCCHEGTSFACVLASLASWLHSKTKIATFKSTMSWNLG